MKSFYKPGEWNAICDVCGFKFKSGQMKLRWDGLMVCKNDWEVRNPQDLIRIPKENPSVPWSRPEHEETYLVCTVFNSRAIAGIGVAGCMVAGRATLT